MKKLRAFFTACIIFTIVFQSVAMADLVSLARFDFTPVDYDGEVFDAAEFSDDMFMVCGKEHMSGFVNGEGKSVIGFDFSCAGSFVDSLAPASVPYGKMGYIDKSGKFEIEPRFDSAAEFSDGLALVQKDEKTGFIDKTGRFVDIIKNSDYTPVSSFAGGVCWVERGDGKRAVMDSRGELLTGFDFVWSSEWSDGVCWASKDTGSDFNHISMGLIDKSGEFIIQPGIYTDAQQFSEGLCWAKKIGTDRIFLIDKEAHELKSVENGRMPSKFSGGICVNLGKDLLAVMDTTGTVIWSSKKYYPIHYGGFQGGKMIVKSQSDSKYYIMNDLKYVKLDEQKQYIEGYGYANEDTANESFEIALKINSPYALVNGEVKMIEEGDERVYPFIENSRTLLPMRFIAENLEKYSVSWDYLTNSALVRNDYISILLKADMPSAQVIRYMPEMRSYEQHTKSLDQPPVNAYDRLFLPVRALCEMIGVNVFYDERGLVVISNDRSGLSYDDAGAIVERLSLYERESNY